MASFPRPLSLHRVVMMVAMMSVMVVITNDHLFRAGAIQAGLVLAHFNLRAGSVGAAARRVVLDLAASGRALVRLGIWHGF